MTHIGYLKYLEAIGPSLDEGTKSLLSSVWDLAYAQGLREGVAIERNKKNNSCLIEAAPDLLSALNAMMTHMGMDEDDWNKATFDKARAAVAKATGEQHKGKTK